MPSWPQIPILPWAGNPDAILVLEITISPSTAVEAPGFQPGEKLRLGDRL